MAIAGCSQPRTITVTEETTGRTQVVSPVNESLYQGNGSDFTSVLLSQDPSYGWLVTVYDYADVSSPLYPFAQFGQVVPDTNDPAGDYGLLVNGKPNSDRARMRVYDTAESELDDP